MKIVKMYLKYQITLSNILIMLFLFLFLSLCYFININDINTSLDYDQVLSFYFQNSLYYTKIIMVFISCFLFMKLKNERNEYLINIIITAGFKKKDNYKYMILCNILIIIFIITLLFISFLVIGLLTKEYYIIELKHLNSYVNLILLSIHYGLITYLLIQLTNNQMMFIIVIIMFLLSDLLININNEIKYLLFCFLPNLNNINGSFYINQIFIIIFIIFLFKISEYVYLNSDLKN